MLSTGEPIRVDNGQDTSKVLVVAGMHRSGTSLTANWLAQCGLDVGQDLLMGLPDNPAGHYEDRTFVNLHIDMLNDNGVDHFVTPGKSLVIHAEQYQRAREILRARPVGTQWGWKDPRTTLFLPFWKSLIPEMKVLAVYRPYPDVVMSLLRRDFKRWQRRHRTLAPAFLDRFAIPIHAALHVRRARRYLKVWDRYNQDLLAFARSNPADVLVIRLDDVVSRSLDITNFINREWHFSLRPHDAKESFDPQLMHGNSTSFSWRHLYLSLLYWRVRPTWNALEELRTSRLPSEPMEQRQTVARLSGGSR